jgi:hypothetical protein
MADNAPVTPKDLDGNPLPPADIYYVEARDSNNELASKGRVPADRVHRALRLFTDEGWDVTITPLKPGQMTPND